MVGENFHRCAASRTQTGHVALEVEHGLDGNTAAVAGKADGLHRDGRERRDTRGIHAVGGGKGDVGLLSGTQLVRIQLRRFCTDAQRGKICDNRAGKAAPDGFTGARHTEDCAGKGRGDRVSGHGLGFIRVRLHRRDSRLHIGGGQRRSLSGFQRAERLPFFDRIPLAHENLGHDAAVFGDERYRARGHDRAEYGDAVVNVLRFRLRCSHGKRFFPFGKGEYSRKNTDDNGGDQTDPPSLSFHAKHLREIACPEKTKKSAPKDGFETAASITARP